MTENQKKIYDIQDIIQKLPHHYPFLLLDKVVSVEEKKAVGIKNVTFNEPFFPGHFPGNPIMPGVLQIEALAQLAAFHYLTTNTIKEANIYFVSIDKVKFRQIVRPGDTLTLSIDFLKEAKAFKKYSGKITVEEKLVCEGEFMATMQ